MTWRPERGDPNKHYGPRSAAFSPASAELHAAFYEARDNPAPAGLDVERLALALAEVFDNPKGPYTMPMLAEIVAREYEARAATRPAEEGLDEKERLAQALRDDDMETFTAAIREANRPRPAAAGLLDETSEEWTSVERAIWPDGPAHGHGSGAYAVLKAKIIAALASSPAPAGLDDFGTWVRWFLDANPNAEPADLIGAIRERMAP